MTCAAAVGHAIARSRSGTVLRASPLSRTEPSNIVRRWDRRSSRRERFYSAITVTPSNAAMNTALETAASPSISRPTSLRVLQPLSPASETSHSPSHGCHRIRNCYQSLPLRNPRATTAMTRGWKKQRSVWPALFLRRSPEIEGLRRQTGATNGGLPWRFA